MENCAGYILLKNLKKFICELDVNEHPTLELSVEELFSTNDRTNTKRFLTISCKIEARYYASSSPVVCTIC